jgi:asparagine synthase (glutamine-hydrolysing)
MCGIAGIIGNGISREDAVVRKMADAIRYRGPDDSGVWSDAAHRVALGHTRLSILDLSPEGHQPMASSRGRYVITYNGEVYNFAELSKELEGEGARFRGHSDTEVMLAAFEHWGIEKSIGRFVGMFAFGLWDRETRQLHLVRDRIGIKPLYFGWIGRTFRFASELKSMLASAERPEIDRSALALYMRYAYVPAPRSIYQNVFKLPPGCWLTIGLDQASNPAHFSPEPDDPVAAWKPIRYWSAKQVVEQGCTAPYSGTDEEALGELHELLREAVRLRMVADVPLGAFLSGGIDSSTVVALMQAQSTRPVRTFSIGFREDDYNEAQHAKRVAQHLGTDHTELYLTAAEAMAVIPRLPVMYDEPFGDSSQIPTFLVSQLARQHVTVALSGDGGDELFAGYYRYFWGRRIWNHISRLPLSLRKVLSQIISGVSPERWTALFSHLDRFLPALSNPGHKMYRLSELLTMKNPDSIYLGLVSQWATPTSIVRGAQEPLTPVTDHTQWANVSDFTLRMMFLDLITYLPDDILTKVDRASMSVSLEARVPLLDHRVVEFAWRLPMRMKIREEGAGKWILRQLLHRYVPPELLERPKMGFGIPIEQWLRGPLRGWAGDLLAEERLRRQGYLHPELIREKWTEHVSGKRNWPYLLWNVLMFQAWLEQ